MIAMRLRDTAFRLILQAIPLGTELKIEGLLGNLVLHNKAERPAVFLTGGIRIQATVMLPGWQIAPDVFAPLTEGTRSSINVKH